MSSVSAVTPARLPFLAPECVAYASAAHPLSSRSKGSIRATATGGTGTISDSKDRPNFQASGSFTGLAAGPYPITAKDTNGCTVTTPVTINAAPSAIVLNATPTQPLCSTDKGSISASASGGTSSFTYSTNGTTFQTSG